MAKFECNNCTYKTNHQSKFDQHLNRKIPCVKNNLHKNVKKIDTYSCEECNKEFASKQSLTRHNDAFHNEIKIVGDNNIPTIIKGNNNVVAINNLVIQPILNKYDEYDINNLTIYEQYLSLTSKTSPYTALLDNYNLNPTKEKYHNMIYKDDHRSTMEVYDGNKWIKEVVNNALSNVVCSERIMIGLIFNRFRIFLNRKATKLIPQAYYFGYKENYYFHKKVVQNIKLHLYNNQKNKNEVEEKIPKNEDNEVWWAITKRFKWSEVESYINKMDEYEINFDKTLDEIKDDINKLCKEDQKMAKFFKKLLLQINDFIKDFNNAQNSDVSSEELNSDKGSE
uniref:C2H2-type domain-containing protein n=1 Tax=viral metagenome TaxID=1070528 RepID=A0A6C0LQL5_9ZZZZ